MEIDGNPYVAIDIELLHSLSKIHGGGILKRFEKSIGLKFYDETVDYYIYVIKDKKRFIYGLMKYNIPLEIYEYRKY